jgi:hypothetical protein
VVIFSFCAEVSARKGNIGKVYFFVIWVAVDKPAGALTFDVKSG